MAPKKQRKTKASRPKGGASAAARAARPKDARRSGSGASKARASGAFGEVEELVRLMDAHGLLEVDFESSPDGSRRIRVSRQEAPGFQPAGFVPQAAPAPAASGAAAAASEAAEPAAPAVDPNLHAFKSPMVGTFYRAPSPEAPPFASVGDKVDEHTTLCIIEAMKVMNEITPDVSGEVVSIEVENGEAVEFGQTLFLIRRA